MNLLAVNYEYPPLGGGGGVVHRDILETLAARHNVVVLTSHFEGLPRVEVRGNLRIHRVPVWGRTDLATATLRSMVSFAPAVFWAGRSILRQFRPDLIHAFFAVPSGPPALFLKKLTARPLVLTLVGADVYDPEPTAGIATHRHPLIRPVIRTVIQAADVRTAISEDTKRRAIEYHGAPTDIVVIPPGLRTPPLNRRTTTREHSGGIKRLLTIGRLIPRKALSDLLVALSLLPRSDIHLDIVGEGPLAGDLRSMASRLGLASRVTLHGSVGEERKWQLLMGADCFVSASLHEGFGLVFLEAMRAGLPIVCTESGGQTDVLTEGEHALFVPTRRPRELASALAQLFGDVALARRLGKANREKAQHFHIEQVAVSYERVFETARATWRAARRALPRSLQHTPPMRAVRAEHGASGE